MDVSRVPGNFSSTPSPASSSTALLLLGIFHVSSSRKVSFSSCLQHSLSARYLSCSLSAETWCSMPTVGLGCSSSSCPSLDRSPSKTRIIKLFLRSRSNCCTSKTIRFFVSTLSGSFVSSSKTGLYRA